MHCELILVHIEVIRVRHAVAPLDLVVVVVEGLLVDILVFACELFVPQFKIYGSLFLGHWQYIALDLVVVVAQADRTPPKHHVDCLLHGTAA